MCLAVPAKVIDKFDMLAVIDIEGVTRNVSTMLLPDVEIGDFVLVHAGFVIQAINEEEARRTMELLKELTAFEE